MFKQVPQADAYSMKMILHDWNDAECVEILSNVRRSARPGGRVFIVDDEFLRRYHSYIREVSWPTLGLCR